MLRRIGKKEPKIQNLQGSNLVEDLNITQKILVWSMRRLSVSPSDRLVPSTFERLVGNDNATMAAEHLLQIIRFMAVSSLHQIAPLQEGQLAPAEKEILRFLGLAQQGATIRLLLQGSQIVTARDKAQLEKAVCSLAAILATSGALALDSKGLSLQAADEEFLAALETVEAPAVTSPALLSFQERLLVEGIRGWVACLKQNENSFKFLEDYFVMHGLPQVALSLQVMLSTIAQNSHRMVDVRCMRCQSLSPDEARIITIAAEQGARKNRHGEKTDTLLAFWLQPSAVRFVIEAAAGIGNEMADKRLPLPLRAWQFPEFETGNETWDDETWTALNRDEASEDVSLQTKRELSSRD